MAEAVNNVKALGFSGYSSSSISRRVMSTTDRACQQPYAMTFIGLDIRARQLLFSALFPSSDSCEIFSAFSLRRALSGPSHLARLSVRHTRQHWPIKVLVDKSWLWWVRTDSEWQHTDNGLTMTDNRSTGHHLHAFVFWSCRATTDSALTYLLTYLRPPGFFCSCSISLDLSAQ